MITNVFTQDGVNHYVERINKLQPSTQPLWGKMSVGQMLAHCNVTYEMALENNHKKPNGFMRFLLKLFVKNGVVSEKLYKHNSPTAPAFIIKETKDFQMEKDRLLAYIKKTLELGTTNFEGKESLSFGKLNSTEWNNMFSKHLDHHLKQFGV